MKRLISLKGLIYNYLSTTRAALMVLLMGIFMLAANAGFGQATTSMATPCDVEGCKANDVEISSVYLADIHGNKIETCSSGTFLI